jgi:hypothetical protein
VPPLIFSGPLIGPPGGGGPQWPTDTSPYLEYAEQHFTTFDFANQGNNGFTISPPPGTDRTSLGRSIALAIISGAELNTVLINPTGSDDFWTLNPGWVDVGQWRRINPNSTLLRTMLFYRRFDGTASDDLIVPAYHTFNNFSVTYLILGQHTTTPAMRKTGEIGWSADGSTVFDIGGGTYANDFNVMELLFAHRRYTVADNFGSFIAAPTLDNIDVTGGWLEIFKGVDQSVYTNAIGGAQIQNTQWLHFWGRHKATSPDADSSKARTFAYTPSPQFANQFVVYFRYEIGF